MKMLAASGGSSSLPLGDVVAGQLLTQAHERNTTVSDLSQPSGLCWQRTDSPSLPASWQFEISSREAQAVQLL